MKAISFDFHNALIGEHWKVKIFPFHHSKCHSYLCHQLEQKKDIWWRHLKAGKVEIYNFSRSGLLGFDHCCKYYINLLMQDKTMTIAICLARTLMWNQD